MPYNNLQIAQMAHEKAREIGFESAYDCDKTYKGYYVFLASKPKDSKYYVFNPMPVYILANINEVRIATDEETDLIRFKKEK